MKKISISPGNNKMGEVPSVSTPPIKACAKWVTKACGKACYAMKAYRIYKATHAAYDRNLEIATNHREEFFQQVMQYLVKKQPVYFRWHVSGDMLDQDYVDNVVKVARLFPHTKFLAFTKRYEFDYTKKPDNLSIVFSAWPGVEVPNPNNYPIAWMQDGTEDRIPEKAFKCNDGCDTCGVCWDLKTLDKDVIFNKH